MHERRRGIAKTVVSAALASSLGQADAMISKEMQRLPVERLYYPPRMAALELFDNTGAEYIATFNTCDAARPLAEAVRGEIRPYGIMIHTGDADTNRATAWSKTSGCSVWKNNQK